jgi:hypothetical protein
VVSAAASLHSEATLLEGFDQRVALVALNFDRAVLERAPGSAAALQHLREIAQFAFGQLYTADQRDRLAPSALRATTDPDDAVAVCIGDRRAAAARVRSALAAFDWKTTMGAEPACLR